MRLVHADAKTVVASASTALHVAASDPLSLNLVSGLLRRAAWFECPCAPRSLKRPITASLQPLVDPDVEAATVVEEVLDGLVSLGDLVEEREQSASATAARRLLYLACPSFVPTGSGRALVLGIGPGGSAPVPDALAGRIEMRGLSRSIGNFTADDRDQLLKAGLVEVSYEQWLGSPTGNQVSSADVVRRCEDALRRAPGAEQELPLEILDSHRSPLYYKGRWGAPNELNGLHVARREVQFGADRWCIVQLEKGRAVRLLDLPAIFEGQRACDEAWTIQAAIDAERKAPQRYRLALAGVEWSVEVFAPLPAWLKRAWEVEGAATPVKRGGGRTPLIAYRFSDEGTARRNAGRLEQDLWMQPLT